MRAAVSKMSPRTSNSRARTRSGNAAKASATLGGIGGVGLCFMAVEPGDLLERVGGGERFVAPPLLGPIGEIILNFAAAAHQEHVIRPGPTQFLVTLQRRLDRIRRCRFQAVGERHGVLHALRGALREKGQHRVGGVSEQRNAPSRPLLQWSPIEERPTLGLGRRDDKLMDALVPSFELARQIRNLAVRRPNSDRQSPAGTIATMLMRRPAEIG